MAGPGGPVVGCGGPGPVWVVPRVAGKLGSLPRAGLSRRPVASRPSACCRWQVHQSCEWPSLLLAVSERACKATRVVPACVWALRVCGPCVCTSREGPLRAPGVRAHSASTGLHGSPERKLETPGGVLHVTQLCTGGLGGRGWIRPALERPHRRPTVRLWASHSASLRLSVLIREVGTDTLVGSIQRSVHGLVFGVVTLRQSPGLWCPSTWDALSPGGLTHASS